MNHITKLNISNFFLLKIGYWLLVEQHTHAYIVTIEGGCPVKDFFEDKIINAEQIGCAEVHSNLMMEKNLLASETTGVPETH